MPVTLVLSVDRYLELVDRVAPIARQFADWFGEHARPADESVDALRDNGHLRMLSRPAVRRVS